MPLDSSRSIRHGGTAVLSDNITQSFNERTQYIALGEDFAPLHALWHETGYFEKWLPGNAIH